MILYHRAFMRIAEAWFDEAAGGVQADILRRFQHSTPTGANCIPFSTLLLDLTRDSDLLFGQMKRETRYEVRRAAEKDRLKHEMWIATDSNCVTQFASFYLEVCVEQGLPKLNIVRLQKFMEAKTLSLSVIREGTGVPLVWHAYYRNRERARLLYSASQGRKTDPAQRSLLGRANRYHHWQDLLAFKLHGTQVYDFGGWYAGDSDNKGLSINKFKEGFGGQKIVNYNSVQGLTKLGKAALWLYRRMGPM